MLPSDLNPPKFLTQHLALHAMDHVVHGLFPTENGVTHPLLGLKRPTLHVVIIVPGRRNSVDTNKEDWMHLNHEIHPLILAEGSYGTNWPYRFDVIARSKALQLWENRNEGNTDIEPHLLFSGDAPYWGGVKRRNIVVACSGVQPWFDRMASGMIADVLIALSYNMWMTSEDKERDEEILG